MGRVDALEREATLESKAGNAASDAKIDSLSFTPENTVGMDADGTLTVDCSMKTVRNLLAEAAGGKTAYLKGLQEVYGGDYLGYLKLTATGILLYKAPVFPPLLRLVEKKRIETLVSLVKDRDASVIDEAARRMTLNPLLLFTTYTHQSQTQGKKALIISRGIDQVIDSYLDNPQSANMGSTVNECRRMNLPEEMMEAINTTFREGNLTPRRLMEHFGYAQVDVAAHTWLTRTDQETGKEIFTGDVQGNRLAEELFGGIITTHAKLSYPCSLYFGDTEERRYLIWNFMKKQNFINVEDKPLTKVEHFLTYLKDMTDALQHAGEKYKQRVQDAGKLIEEAEGIISDGKRIIGKDNVPFYGLKLIEEHGKAFHQMFEEGEAGLRTSVKNLVNFINYTAGDIGNKDLLAAARTVA